MRPRAVSKVMTQPCQLDALDVLVCDPKGVIHVSEVCCHESSEVAHAWQSACHYSFFISLMKEIWKPTETVLEPVMRGTGEDIVGETELFDVPQTLKVFSRRLRR